MNYSSNMCGDKFTTDYNYVRYVGWGEDNACIRKLYSLNTIRMISKKVSELTKGVDPKNRTILVPDERIYETLDGIYTRFRPTIGDIYSRYIVPNNESENYVQKIIDQTIETIVSTIKNELGMQEYNKTLSVWVQMYGDFNTHGLRQHSIIKVQEKRPSTMQFNMNY